MEVTVEGVTVLFKRHFIKAESHLMRNCQKNKSNKLTDGEAYS